jgi:hypothetical protein
MKFEISEDTLRKTDKCQDMKCLEEDGRPECKVDRQLKGNGVFVSPNGRDQCPYKMSFGNAYVCNCPTRFELFDKYNV